MAMTANLDHLFHQIIQDPLENSEGILPVIVIDALDECGGLEGRHSQHRKNVLRTLRTWSKLPPNFKIVVTSRGEDDIERTFQHIGLAINISAGLNATYQSRVDIETFLFHGFREIATSSSLESDWPGLPVVRQLADKSGGLFIWARVALEFIARGEPENTLRLVQGGNDGGTAPLYSTILEVSFPNPSSMVLKAFHSILGAVILAKEPLSSTSLGHLLAIETSVVQYICKGLKSVVNSEDILRITHQSFVDFFINTMLCSPPFCIELEHEELRLVLRSLQTMKNELQFNICNLE
jgi:hypothetical protein